jgi:cytochrome c-type protein NrfB
MLKKAIIVGVSVLSLAFVGTAFAEGNGAETIVLKGGSLGDVTFPHKAHQDNLKDCDACHKLFPQEAGAIEKLIASGKLKKKEVMKNCETCHKETKAKGAASGPTSCKGCHKK